MAELPDTGSLASMVTEITETMFGLSFFLNEAAAGFPWPAGARWHTVAIAIAGRPDVTVALAADEAATDRLAAAMFAVSLHDVDASMRSDSLSELVNIVAGQVKNMLGPEHALGLPRVLADPSSLEGIVTWRSAALSSDSSRVSFWVAVADSQLDAKEAHA